MWEVGLADSLVWDAVAPFTRMFKLCRKHAEQRNVCRDDGNLRYCVESDNYDRCECIAQEVESILFKRLKASIW